MAEQGSIKRVEIIIEALELQRVVSLVEQAGATGYTVIPHVHGKGHRGVRTDLGFSDVLRNVMVIVVAPAPVAAKIAQDVSGLFKRRAGLLTVTAVESCHGLEK